MKWGSHVKTLKAQERMGVPVKALRNRPSIRSDLKFVWEIFCLVDSTRSIGMGIGGIPISEIDNALDLKGITNFEMKLWYIDIIRAVDKAYIEMVNKKKEK